MIKTVGVRDIAACAAFCGMAYAWLQPLSCVVGFFGLCCADGLSGQFLSSFFQAWRGCTTAAAQPYDGRHTHFMATATRAYGGRRKFSVSRPSERHDSVKFLSRVKKALCFRRFPLGISGVQPLPVARRGGPSADIPPLPHHENDMENYFCKYSSTCAAMSLPLARALTTRLAPLAASPATKTFSG